MQESIFTSIIIITFAFSIILIGVILLINKYHKSIELKNKEIFSSIILAEEKERERLSRDVHDELGGLITSARLKLGSIAISDLGKDDKDKLIEVEDVLEMASISARNASLELSPVALKKFGLEGASNTFPNLYKTHQAIFEINCIVHELNSSVEIGIYRIISEIVNNSIKYSNASKIKIDLNINGKEELIVSVFDDGIGFDLKNISDKSNGVRNIKNRCKVLNGQLNILTSPGNGVQYVIKFKKEHYVSR
jgi:signal transduction histidine kinase